VRRQLNAYRRDELDYRRQQAPEAVVFNNRFDGDRDLAVAPWAGWPTNVSRSASVSGLRSTVAFWDVTASGPDGGARASALAGRVEEVRLQLWPADVLPDPPASAEFGPHDRLDGALQGRPVGTEVVPESGSSPVGDPLDAWLVAGPGISRSAQPWSPGTTDNRRRAGGSHRAQGRRWHAAAPPQRT
jgi:hypothetical protein